MNPKEVIQQNNESKKFIDSQTPTSATDSIMVAHRGDGSILIRLASLLPNDLLIENHRTLISNEVAKSLINTLSEVTNYYPKKPRVSKKPSTK